jgi:hypothetical protein
MVITPHQRDQTHLALAQLAELQAESRQDQRELRDLGHREPRQQTGAAPVVHRPHDRPHDQRIAHQHKGREQQGGPQVQSRRREVEA